MEIKSVSCAVEGTSAVVAITYSNGAVINVTIPLAQLTAYCKELAGQIF